MTYRFQCEKCELAKENEQLKQSNKGLQSELQIFRKDVTHSNKIIDKLNDENEQLKSDLTYWRTLAQSLAKTNGKR